MDKPEEHFIGIKKALEELISFDHEMEEKRKTFAGYPCNASFQLADFFKWWEESCLSQSPLNDVGDPFSETPYHLNAHRFEREVLDYFAALYGLENYWGYVTSGGTQGNEQGLYMGREFLSRYGKPILYFSEEAHYSISSLANLLGIEYRKILPEVTGEMKLSDLEKQLEVQRPALFSLSIGTTFKGGIDAIEAVQELVQKKGIEHVYYHADAALFGGYLPFLKEEEAPSLNFSEHPYDSIAVSGHKFFGSPVPLGICLVKKEYLNSLKGEFIQYIDTHNLTIPCSRSSLNTLIFWWILSTKKVEVLQKEAEEVLRCARYLYAALKKRHYPVWLNPYSNTVYFQRPSHALCDHWSLATMDCPVLGPLAHVVVMQHIDETMIQKFLKDLDQEIPAHHVA